MLTNAVGSGVRKLSDSVYERGAWGLAGTAVVVAVAFALGVNSDTESSAAVLLGGFLVGLFTRPRFALALLVLAWALLIAWVYLHAAFRGANEVFSEMDTKNVALLATMTVILPAGVTVAMGLGAQRLFGARR